MDGAARRLRSTVLTRLSFGLAVSTRSAETTAKIEALARWMKENARIEIEGRPAASYEELVRNVREGSIDIAWLPPVAYAWLAERVTAIGSIARGGKTSYSAALVVREDSPAKSLSDLKDLRAGWADPWSAAGYVVPRLELVRAGISPSSAFRSETFHGSHRDALLALKRSECDVVGTYARTPEGDAQAREGAWTEIDGLSVRVLATFGAIPPDVVAVRRNLGPREHDLVSSALRSACQDEAGRKLFSAVFDGDELREGTEPGHDELRRAYEKGVARGLFDRDA